MNQKPLPKQAKFNRHINQLAACIPAVQYAYKGLMNGDDVTDKMSLKRAKSGEKIEREHVYEVNHYNFVNHKRALKKIVKTSKSKVEMRQRINSYMTEAKQKHETQQMLMPKSIRTIRKRIAKFLTRILTVLN